MRSLHESHRGTEFKWEDQLYYGSLTLLHICDASRHKMLTFYEREREILLLRFQFYSKIVVPMWITPRKLFYFFTFHTFQIMAFSTAEDGLKYLHQGEFTVEGIKVSIPIENS